MEPKTSTSRLPEWDVLRLGAVAAMVVCHSIRLIPYADRPGWACFFLAWEPLVQVVFFVCLGASLSLAYEKKMSKQKWMQRIFARAAFFWCIGFVMLAVERGWQGRLAFVNTGFLGIAAISTLVGGLVLLGSKPVRIAFWIAAVMGSLGGYWFLYSHRMAMAPFIAGNGPWFPLMTFSLLGMAMARLSLKAHLIWLGGAVVLLCVHSCLFGWDWTAFANEARLHIPMHFASLAGSEEVFYYTIAPKALPLLLGTLLLLRFLASWKRGSASVAKPWFAAARHSLFAYVSHLALLGLWIALSGDMSPLPAFWALPMIFLFVVAVLCLAWCWEFFYPWFSRIHGSVGLERRPPEP